MENKTKVKKDLNICLICSTGGHIKQLLALRSSYQNYRHFYVLFYKGAIKDFIKQNKVYFVISPERNLVKFLINFFQALKIFFKEWPDVIISSGAGVAIPMCFIAKISRRKIVFVEDWCAIVKPTLTGKIVYPISDLFIIQRESLKKFYPKAVFGGEIH